MSLYVYLYKYSDNAIIMAKILTMTKNTILSAGVILIHRKGNDVLMLLVKDKATKTWGFPKGQVENNESLENTAKRELFQETGVDEVLITNYLGKLEYGYTIANMKFDKTVHYFLGFTKVEKIKKDHNEILIAKWVKPSEAKNLIQYDDLQEFIEKTNAILSKQDLKSSQIDINTGERFLDNNFFSKETKAHHIARYNLVIDNLHRTENVLDVGCGSGYGSYLLSQKSGSVLGIDICEDAIQYANSKYKNKNLTYSSKDINVLEAKFDIITCFEVIEHIELLNIPDFLESLRNRLTPNGKLYISTPTDARLNNNIYHKSQLDHNTLRYILNYTYNKVFDYDQDWSQDAITKDSSLRKDFAIFCAEKPHNNLNNADKKIREVAIKMTRITKKIFNQDLVSILMYGSQVFNNEYTQYSDYDFIIIIERKYNDFYKLRSLREELSPEIKFMYKYLDEIPKHPEDESTDYVLSPFNFELKLAVCVYGHNPYLTKQDKIDKVKFAHNSMLNSQMRLYWLRKGLMFYPKLQFNRRLEFYLKNLIFDFQNILILDGYLYKNKEDMIIQIHNKYNFMDIQQFKYLQKFISGNVEIDIDHKSGLMLLSSILKIHEKVTDHLR